MFSFLGFFLIYYAATAAYDSAVRENAMSISSQLARTTFNSMFQIMRQGWTREQLEEFLTNTHQNNNTRELQIQIYRGPLVEKLYGPIEQPPRDSFVNKSFSTQQVNYEQSGDWLRYNYPLLAKKECQTCHSNAKIGDVLGSIEVKQNLTALVEQAQGGMLVNLLMLAPIPFVLAIIVIFLMNKRINQSVNHLENNIEKVSKVSDLTQFNISSNKEGFSELNHIFGKVEVLTERLKGVAVDKELLEFEIRLLEKFVITSEIVRDWREYISILLKDINTVMPVYTLFSIFKVDDEMFALEIFWISRPEQSTKKLLESEIRKELNNNPTFKNLFNLEINHIYSDQNTKEIQIDFEQVRLQTKSLFLKAPKIGGIVGIGVNAESHLDETRLLVSESILSTLINVVGSVKAIYKYTKDLEYYATRDPLTDLHNQRLFWEMLEHEIILAQRHNQDLAILMIDLDNFKSINDSYGHVFGDKYLQEIAKVLTSAIRPGDLVSRYGGDEFALILPEGDLAYVEEISNKIYEKAGQLAMQSPLGEPIQFRLSMGLALYPEHADNAKDLFMFADNMMYQAKSSGKNRLYIPNKEDVLAVFKDISEKSIVIDKAIQEKRVIPYFQPMLATKDNEIEAVEVLSRIVLEDDQIMGAHEFIEIAEKLGVIHSLDLIVIEKAFAKVREENFKGLIFVNMSPRSLVLNEFIPEIKRFCQLNDIAHNRVVFEITERETVKNISLLEKFVNNLKSDGFNLAIDDFGSGFSSFHYLKHFPIDFVKIEGEFVANMVNDPKDKALVHSISALAHELGARTIAEYVESEEVLEAVRLNQITYAQGFHIRRPQPYILAENSNSETNNSEESMHNNMQTSQQAV